MTVLFQHDFKDGIAPFKTRHAGGQDLPSSDDAATIVDGALKLSLLNNPLRTGHVWCEDFTVVEGYVEFTMKFPAPAGVHSAGWMQSVTPYATADDHEIDVAEHFGHSKVMQHAIWTGPGKPVKAYHGSAKLDVGRWNRYGVDCRRGGYIFTINGVQVGQVKRVDTGLRSIKPKNLIISLLSDDWERDDVDFFNLEDYYVLCSKVRVLSERGW